jgi:predicted ATPase/DNA-binding CsgD family transcriptional regulator
MKEQVNGWNRASDQYTLAVMVYEWLCDRFSCRRAEAVSAPLWDVPASLYEGDELVPLATSLLGVDHPRPAPHDSWYLPVPLTPLIGRQHELQLACDRLLCPQVRLLTLTGAPGVGKTRLALALGAALQPVFDQVCFVSLAAIDDSNLLAPAIMCALGLPRSRVLSPFECLVASLRERHLLLLLDDFMHLLPAASLLAELLSACPQLKILVTSRASLHIQGEYRFVVPPLALPDLHRLPEVEELSQVEAVALFLQRAEALNQEFKLTRNNAALIARICTRLDGLPLAIELAAEWIGVLPLEMLYARLEHSLDMLTNGKQNVPSHRQTLRDTIAWSYHHLTTAEQILFRWLAVFVGAFTLEAAEAVVSASGSAGVSVLDGIGALIDKSLLQRQEEKPELRLHLLEFMRAYGWECLRASQELEQAREAHARYYLALTERAESTLLGATPILGQGEEYENIRAALQWLHEHHEHDAALLAQPALTVKTQTLPRRKNHSRHPLRAELQSVPTLSTYLTARECEVLRFLSLGLSNKQIAERLVLSPFTVNRHVQSIYGKLGVSSRSAATRIAIEQHLHD